MPRYEYPSLRQGLVGCWVPSLGASGLTLIDRSGRNNHGTLTNMGGQYNWQASGSGVALNFDGTNDYVSRASVNYVASFPFTIALWMNVSSAYRSAASGRTYIAQATSYLGTALSLFSIATDYSTSSDKLYYFENDNVRLTTETFSVGQWQHVAFCFDSTSTVRFFLNGRQGTIQQPGGSFASLGSAGMYLSLIHI